MRELDIYYRLAAACLLIGTACTTPEQGRSQGASPASISSNIIKKTAPLSNYLSPELVGAFDLGPLANIPADVHELKLEDTKPTFVHVYDPSVVVIPQAVHSAYEALSGRNLRSLVNNLKEGGKSGQDYVDDLNEPTITTFKYDYSMTPKLPIGISLYSREEATMARHILVLSQKQNPPQWADIAEAVTRFQSKDSAQGQGIIALSIINTDRLKMRPGSPDIHLTEGVLTEICQQMVAVVAISQSRILDTDDPLLDIAQEGACNTIGDATTFRRLSNSWQQVERIFTTTPIILHGTPIRRISFTQAAYNSLPTNGPLLVNKP